MSSKTNELRTVQKYDFQINRLFATEERQMKNSTVFRDHIHRWWSPWSNYTYIDNCGDSDNESN